MCGEREHVSVFQCILTLNVMNEKVYMFLSLWLLFVGFVSVIDCLVFVVQFLPCVRRRVSDARRL